MRSHTIVRSEEPDIHVVETGPRDAQSILFLHGYSQGCLSWREQLNSSLADEFHMVAIDLRGHGDSEKPRGGYDDSEAWAGDIQTVVEARDLESFVLVGWSYGSLVALDYLATHGAARVAGVNLIGLVTGIGTERTNAWLEQEYIDLFPALVSKDAETSAEALERFIEQCFETELSPENRYFLLGINTVVPPYVRNGMRDRTVSHIGFLKNISVPVLLTHGTCDGVISIDAAQEAYSRIPNSTLSEYSEDGHTPFWESSERFNRELRDFAAGLFDLSSN